MGYNWIKMITNATFSLWEMNSIFDGLPSAVTGSPNV